MGLFQKLKFNKAKNPFQPKSKNDAVFSCMREHGFSLPAIRRALMALNAIKMADLADGRLSVPTTSNVIAGRRRNRMIMANLANRLDLPFESLFPEEKG